ncbi:MAG: hypothetical protein LBH00_03720, partial [Planctomycetaceae bacterium]|nr:hypothetical protein [Planctomycetaceae bacterium]
MATSTFLSRVLIIFALLFSSAGFVAAAGNNVAGETADKLAAGFAAPPAEAKLWCFWWWLNGNVTKTAITQDLEAMKAKGFGGVFIIDANGSNIGGNKNVSEGPMYSSPEWIELFRHAVQEADRLGLSVSVNIQSGWDVGGPVVPPEHAIKRIVHSATAAEGGKEIVTKLPQPKTVLNYYKDVAVLAVKSTPGKKRTPLKHFNAKIAVKEVEWKIKNSAFLTDDEPDLPGDPDTNVDEVIVLTGKMDKDGQLQWNAPAGNWDILRFGYTLTGKKVVVPSGQWQGLVIDYLSAEAFDFYWEKAVHPVLEPVKPHWGKTLRYFHSDSYEAGGINWTPLFVTEFQKRRGYDPVPYLPVIAGYILNDRNTSNRFLNDYRRTLADLIAENHYRRYKETARKYNMGIHPESGGPPTIPMLDALQTLGISDIPMAEYWAKFTGGAFKQDKDRWMVKQPASAAHTNGHKLVAAEGFTSIGPHWNESFSHNLKPTFDYAVCTGLNLHVWCLCACSPDETGEPGQDMYAGTHFNRHHFTFQKSQDFLKYINRVQFLLQQGLPSADVLEYNGENVPGFTEDRQANSAKSLPGYDYDVASESVLLNQIDRVENGRIFLKDGVNYRVLVLPNRNSISRAALAKIEELVRNGATVIGPKPERTTGLDFGLNLQPISTALWDNGKIITGKTSREVLQERGVPFDFERVSGSNAKPRVEWIHRTVYQNQLDKLTFREFKEFAPSDVSTIPADFNSGVAAEIYFVANLTETA